MACWVQVAKTVLSAEFPDFELLQSFSIFTAATKVSTGMNPDAFVTENERHFRRLAAVFNVDADDLAKQFVDHVFIAKEIMRGSTGTTLREAWRQAVLRTQNRASLRDRHPVDALRPVLLRYLVYIASTTAIEHGFAKRLRTLNVQQFCSEEVERNLVKVIMDQELVKHRDTIVLAQKIWAGSYAAPRKVNTPHRLDKGVPQHSRRLTKRSEAGWQRKRRLEVKHGQHGSPQGVQAAVSTDGAWCDALQKEVDFQEDKLKKRKLEAYRDGLLLEEEVDERLQQEATQATKKEVKAAHDRHEDELRHQRRVVVPLPAMWYKDKAALICEGLLDDDKATLALNSLGMQIAPDRASADVFLVSDPAVVSKRSLWAAVLKGGYVSTIEGLYGKGAAVKYEPALTSKRHIWFSPGFCAKHPMVVEITGQLLRAVAKAKWKIIELEHVAGFVERCKRDRHLLGLVEQAEKQDPVHLIAAPRPTPCQTHHFEIGPGTHHPLTDPLNSARLGLPGRRAEEGAHLQRGRSSCAAGE
jgi:hypothetical protein